MRKPGFIKKVLSSIKESSYHKQGGKLSSSRLSSWAILGVIVLANLAFIGIDVANAITAISTKGFFEIPSNHIVLYGMTLAHHLTLLNISKTSERKIEQAIQDKLKGQDALNPKDISTNLPEEENM